MRKQKKLLLKSMGWSKAPTPAVAHGELLRAGLTPPPYTKLKGIRERGSIKSIPFNPLVPLCPFRPFLKINGLEKHSG